MPRRPSVVTIPLSDTGGIRTINLFTPIDYYVISGENLNLGGSWSFAPLPEVPDEDTVIKFLYRVTVASSNGNSIVIFGKPIPPDMLSKQSLITAYLVEGDWDIKISPDFEEDDIITRDHIQDRAVGSNEIDLRVVDLAHLAAMGRGTVRVGGSVNEPTNLYSGASGNILVGDGFDVKSVLPSRDVTLQPDGLVDVKTSKFLDTGSTSLPAVVDLTTLKTITLSTANVLSTINEGIQFTAGGALGSGANTKTLRVLINGVQFFQVSDTEASVRWWLDTYLYRNGEDTIVGQGVITYGSTQHLALGAFSSPLVTSGSSIQIAIQGQSGQESAQSGDLSSDFVSIQSIR